MNTGIIHVYPVGDLREHVTDGTDCWCEPEFDNLNNLMIHNSADDREAFETGGRLPS